MPTYRVRENNQVATLNGICKAGDELELSEKEAASISHAVELIEEEIEETSEEESSEEKPKRKKVRRS